jgi:hypothetical protein
MTGSGGISYTILNDGASRKLTEAEAKITGKAVMGLNKIGVLTTSKLKAKAPRDTSNMVNHIHAIPATPGKLSVEIVADASYTVDVDKGTKPHFPPPAALIGWAKRHPYKDYSPEASAFLIARAISKRGTKATNFIETILVEARADAKMTMLEAMKGVTL